MLKNISSTEPVVLAVLVMFFFGGRKLRFATELATIPESLIKTNRE